jgi:deoxycytidylate deaminase
MMFEEIRLSDYLYEVRDREQPSTKPCRREMQALGDRLRESNGRDFLVRKSLERAISKNLVIDGIRNVGEIDHLRDRFGYHFTLFAIIPTFQARWDRLGSKQYNDDREGNRLFFADDHRDQDEDVEFGQQVRKCVDQADILIDNSETVPLGKYKQKVLEYTRLAIGETRRAPLQEEILMNMAYSACHSSLCLKRHVGALVVDAENNPIGIGYNENPLGTKSCRDQYGGCFKDRRRDEHLKELAEETGSLFCPSCGTKFENSGQVQASCANCTRSGVHKSISDLLFPERGMTYCTAIHAEAWALNSAGERARDGVLFTTTFPCLQCAEKIIHSGIKEVWFTEPYPDPLSGSRLGLAGIRLKQFEGVRCFDRMFANSRPG